MVRIQLNEKLIRIECSKKERIDIHRVRRLVHQSIRISNQNNTIGLVIEFDKSLSITKSAMALMDRITQHSNCMPVAFIAI